MILSLASVLIALGLMAAMLLALEAGRRLGARDLARDASRVGLGAVEGAIFALMGLLLAFTFSGAAARFDARRMLIVEESNAIGTAWLRLDALPAEDQPSLREKFRQYVDARVAGFRRMPDLEASGAELTRAADLQKQI